jgi:hypothetical protein
MARLIHPEMGSAGFGTPPARWGFLLLWLGGVITGALDGGFGPDTATAAIYGAALVVDLGAVLLITEQSARILPAARAAAAAVCTILATAAGLVAYSGGAEAWVMANAITMAALLFARGNPRAATVAVLGTVGPVAVAATAGRIVLGDAVYVLGVAGLLVTCAILWRPGLAGVVRRERRHRTDEARAALEAEAAAVATAEYARQLERVRRDAAPLLERIARSDALEPSDLVELAVVEGAIRDRLRSPLARDEALIAAIADARRRGVRVLLLWDGDPAGTPHPGLVAALTAIVRESQAGSLVIRGGAGRKEMSVMRTGDGIASRVVLDDEGRTLAVT